MDANEMAVVRDLQFINTMQVQYKSEFQRFAATLAELGPPASGEPGPQAADLIPAALSSGDKDGYLFTVTATPSGYKVNANPKIFQRSGHRTFYTDQNGIIRQNWSAKPANASSQEFK
jgi:type IV pilus assembly protein PilA